MIIDTQIIGHADKAGYLIGVSEEIRRVLITRKGSIPMNPGYGSDLWRYRDRSLDDVTRLGIIAETFDTIERNVSRVKPTRVQISQRRDGAFGLKIILEAKEAHDGAA